MPVLDARTSAAQQEGWVMKLPHRRVHCDYRAHSVQKYYSKRKYTPRMPPGGEYAIPCLFTRRGIGDMTKNRLNLELWEVSGAAKNTHVVSAAKEPNTLSLTQRLHVEDAQRGTRCRGLCARVTRRATCRTQRERAAR